MVEMSAPSNNQSQPADGDPGSIEIGWIVAGKFDSADREAIRQSLGDVQSQMQEWFPQFTWKMPVAPLPEAVRSSSVEPVTLLESASVIRRDHHWDFALLVTEAELIGHDKPFAMATISRTLDAAVISTAQIDPRAFEADESHSERVETIRRRLSALIFHVLGHLNGLRHEDSKESILFHPETVEDLDCMRTLSESQREDMAFNLRAVADVRLEEQKDHGNKFAFWFYTKASWINRHEIGNAVWEAKPWQFPIRLSRLTAAGISTMMVLLMTAETWDVAMNQTNISVTGLTLIVLAVTTTFVLYRQKLLLYREHQRFSEQVVITNVSTLLIVLAGLLTTYLLIFVVTLAMSLFVFRTDVISAWVTGLSGPADFPDYVRLTAFISSLGITIGALGMSFEHEHHFRHTTYVDEEI